VDTSLKKDPGSGCLPFGRDTSPGSVRLLVAAIRGQTPAGRAESVMAVSRALARFLMAGALLRRPEALASALAQDVDCLRYGPAVADAVARWRDAHDIIPEVERYMAADPFPLLFIVAAALETADVPFLLTGSLAGGVYGTPRATNDVDLLARLAEASIPTFIGALPPGLYADPAMIADAARRRASFNIIDPIAGAKVDVFVSDDSPFARAQFARGRILALEPSARPLPIVCAEGLVLAKLAWYRAGGEVSEQQWRDIGGILVISGPELDRSWLEAWATCLGLRDLLSRIEAEIAGLQ